MYILLLKYHDLYFEEILELPGNLQHSELHYWTPNADQAQSLPKEMAWMTGEIVSFKI